MRATRYKLLPCESGHYVAADSLQWWYFDAEFPDGHRFMTIAMPRMVGDVNEDRNGPAPGVTFVIMDPQGNNHHSHAYYPGEFHGDADAMRATFGPNTIEGAGGKYHLCFDQGGLGVDLTWESLLPPWPPFPGRGGYMTKPLLSGPRQTHALRVFCPEGPREWPLVPPGRRGEEDPLEVRPP